MAERSAALERPHFDLQDAAGLLADGYGIAGAELIELGSQQDRNFRVTHQARRYVLKVANSAWPRDGLAAQDDALVRLAGHLGHLEAPTLAGPTTVTIVDGVEHVVRLCSYVEGTPLAQWGHLAEPVVRGLGEAAARSVLGLADLTHAGLDRWVQWDLRHSREVVASLLPYIENPVLRQSVSDATAEACDRLDRLAVRLPVQPVHGDLTDDNLVAEDDEAGRPRITGVIDFGDLALGWRAAELAVAAACVLHHADARIDSVLPALRAYDELVRLTDDELEALWPMIVARTAVLVASGLTQVALEPDNAYAADGLDQYQHAFALVTSVPTDVVTAAVRHSLRGGHDLPPSPAGTGLLDAAGLSVLDLGVTSPLLDRGVYLDGEPDLPGIRRQGEVRLDRAGEPSLAAPDTVALGVTVVAAEPLVVTAPWAGEVVVGREGIRLVGGPVELYLNGMTAAAGAVRPGDRLGATARVRVTACALPGIRPPAFAPVPLASGWLAHCPDPSALLGLAPGTATVTPRHDAGAAMVARRAVVPEVQERYYGDVPPKFERGWRDVMVDVAGRPYVDTINNVTLIGHGDPRVAEAAYRQWLLLNTNSRFLYDSLAEYSSRLAALFPPGLDTVFLVNSGSEAVDLALRLAQVHTGRRDVVVVAEAYHGWTEASDAVSTSTHDNPAAATTRRPWVHPVPTPNPLRGVHVGGDQGAYARDALAVIDGLREQGRAPAAFLCEAVYGKEGALAYPDGYLGAVYGAVRTAGGLAIADEVQVGFGRLGSYCWGFEQQGVVPDVVTVAKAVGNGQPLGAVITRREVAESFSREGIFFSTAGGNPVSCRVGLAVLDAWESDGLQEHARVVGLDLQSRFNEVARALRAHELPAAARHGLYVGAVHGMGLYQGLELVRDLTTMEPAAAEVLAICERMLDVGVIMQPTGEHFSTLKMKPPLCLSARSAAHAIDALTHVLATGW